jgi:uncharacterized peroxidase-related enzyme
VNAHAEFLRRVSLDDQLVRAIREDYEQAPLSPADREMLDFVGNLTMDATQIGPADLDRLRSQGFDDQAIVQITLIGSWFNYINRVADALGIGRGDGT